MALEMQSVPFGPIPPADKDVLRELARELAEVAALPVHQEKAELWRRLNRLEKVRPLVWINEICWWEFDGEPELQPACSDEFCRDQETFLRQTLYQWRHMPADMTVDPVIWSPRVIEDTGYGMTTQAVQPDEDHGSAGYVPIILSAADVEKIQMPRITFDAEATDRVYSHLCEIYDGVLPVRKRGVTGFWMAPWDQLIQWYGVTELFVDMVERPELVHAAIDRMVTAMICRLDQLEALGLISLNNCGLRVGSGGLGWTDELPQADFDGQRVRLIDVWGNSAPQIFSGVSPAMHEEFALQYELRFLKRFGLNCYGCCEPLHRKVEMLKSVPRLRRISMSPWVDMDEAAAAVQDKYVFSHKPNPAALATETFRPERARADLRQALETTRDCRVEVIMKDISTVRGEPQRLWQWAEIAMELAAEFAPA